jgi:flavin reductase (DIM6/NTAB) family NADH-FMN oxidoreductase RutF
MTALADAATLTERNLRDAFGAFASGVVAVLGEAEGHVSVLTVSSFSSVSLDPPLAAFYVGNGSTTWPRLREATVLGISVLAEHHGPLARQLAGPAEQRLTDVVVREDLGAHFVAGAVARLRVTVEQESPAGDHTAVLLRVHSVSGPTDAQPLIYHRSDFGRLR